VTDLITDLTDPANLFVMAAATAAGAAVGSIAVNLAVEGMRAGVTKLIDLITGASEDAERLKRFTEARKVWEKLQETAAELDGAISAMMKVYRRGNGLPTQRVLLEVGAELASAERKRDEAKEKALDLYKSGGDTNCIKEWDMKATRFDEKARQLASVMKVVRRNKNENMFCGNMKKAATGLVDVEKSIEDGRSDILAGEEQFWDQFQDRVEVTRENYAHKRKNRSKFLRANVKRARKDYKNYKREQLKVREKWVYKCYEGELDFFQSIPVIGPIFGSFGVMRRCADKYDKATCTPRMKKARQERDLSVRKAQKQIGQSKKVHVEDLVEHRGTVERSRRRNMDFFETLTREQACINDDRNCASLATTRVSLLKGFRNLTVRLDEVRNLCQGVNTNVKLDAAGNMM